MKQFYLLAFLFLFATGLVAQSNIYVDADAAGMNNGSTWADAYTSLSDALDAAADGDFVWVAAGTYTPPADSTFFVGSAVTIIGGFAGTEDDPGAADPEANPTLLSGDVMGDDSSEDIEANKTDNVPIMFVDSLLAAVSISGFTFQGGYNDTFPDQEFLNASSGGAISAYSPIAVSDCNFFANRADFGSAVITYGGASGSSFRNVDVSANKSIGRGALCFFSENITVDVGNFDGNILSRGAIYAEGGANIVVDSCSFTNNIASDRGPAVSFFGTAPSSISNSTIENNIVDAAGAGGAIYLLGAAGSEDPNDFVIDNCIIRGNAGDGGAGGGIYLITANMLARNTLFEANTSASRGGALFATNSDFDLTKVMRFENCDFIENATNGGNQLGGAIYTQRSYVIEADSCNFLRNGNTIDAGRGSGICMLGDFSSTTRRQALTISNSSFVANNTSLQGAAFYVQTPGYFNLVDVTNTEFSGNTGPSIGGAIFTRPGVLSTFDNCDISFNTGDDGGFIWALDEEDAPGPGALPSSVTIMNSRVRENFAATQGGAINVTGGTDLTAMNNVFFGNLLTGGEDAGAGGAIIINGDSAALQSALVVNNTFYSNGAGNFGDDIAVFFPEAFSDSAFTNLYIQNNAFTSQAGLGNVAIEAGTPMIMSLGGNYFGQEVGMDFTAADSDIVNTEADPETFFIEASDFDEADFNLNADTDGGNPLIDGGVQGDNVPATDIAGNDRDTMPDIGAYELVLPTITDIVVASEVHNTLETLVVAAGLAGTLAGEGPFTLFAPTDAAFALIDPAVLNGLTADQVTNTLLTHVISGKVESGMVTDGLSAPSLSTATLNFTNDGAGAVTVSTPQSAVANITGFDLQASNGVVHVIDAVLIPAIVAVNEIDGAGIDVEFFPNPVQNEMAVRVNDANIQEMTVSVVNLNGQRLSNWTMNNGTNFVDFSVVPAGTYTLEINIDGTVYSKQIIKQ